MTGVLDRVLAAARDPAPVASLVEWRARHQHVTAGLRTPIERAVAGGAAMDRIGYTFASGYWAALEVLVPGQTAPAVLAATEAGGAHPRAIEARLTARPGGGWSLSGHKAWCTFGPHAEDLLVVARTGEEADGRPRLKLVRVPREAPGVVVTTLPDTPFVPEIPHASLALTAVELGPDAVLPGDGYADYLKPFRTIEDIHVFAALAGHMAAIALQAGGAGDRATERALALAASLIALAAASPRAPGTHLALGGAIAEGRALAAEVGTFLGGEAGARWTRDVPLLEIAGKARRARLESAHRSRGA